MGVCMGYVGVQVRLHGLLLLADLATRYYRLLSTTIEGAASGKAATTARGRRERQSSHRQRGSN